MTCSINKFQNQSKCHFRHQILPLNDLREKSNSRACGKKMILSQVARGEQE